MLTEITDQERAPPITTNPGPAMVVVVGVVVVVTMMTKTLPTPMTTEETEDTMVMVEINQGTDKEMMTPV